MQTGAILDAPRAHLGSPRLLHVGCGGDPLPQWLRTAGYRETRLDIDERHQPDVLADMCTLGEIGQFQIVLCQHALEHLYPHQVGKALREFLRVLTDDGYAMIVVPDLEGVQPSNDVLFISPAGPIAGMDLFYGFRPKLEEMPHMAHHTGFVSATLDAALLEAGFACAHTRRMDCFNLLGIGIKA